MAEEKLQAAIDATVEAMEANARSAKLYAEGDGEHVISAADAAQNALAVRELAQALAALQLNQSSTRLKA